MDRKTLFSLLAVTAAFLLFTSEPWKRTMRHVFGIPEPVATDSLKVPAAGDSIAAAAKSAPSLSAPDSVAPDSASTDPLEAARLDSLKRLATRRLVVRTEDLEVTLSPEGGRVEGLKLLSVTRRDGSFPSLLPEDRGGALSLKVGDDDLSREIFAPVGTLSDTTVVKAGDSLTVRMAWIRGGRAVERTYVFRGKGQSVGMGLRMLGYPDAPVRLSWDAGLLQIDPAGPRIPFGPPHFNQLVWRDHEEINNFKDPKKSMSASGPLSWVGLRGQYAMTGLLLDSAVEADLSADTLQGVDGAQEASYRWSLRWRPGAKAHMELLATPLEVSTLRGFDRGLDKVLFHGWSWFLRADIWFPELCLFVLGALKFFHKLIPNWGVAIILLTLTARLVLFPLTLRQTRQSKRMAEVMPLLKPKLDALKEKLKNDPRKLQEETMRLYNEHGVNPLASMLGCLPMLLQMPVFFALYMALGRAIELRGAPFFGWIKDLAMPDVVLPMVKIPFIFPLGLTVLPLFMAASLLWLNKMTIKDPQQKALVWMMPIMMLVFSGSFPSGLVLYWTFSNLFSVAQTWVISAGPLPKPDAPEVGGTPKRKGPSKTPKA